MVVLGRGGGGYERGTPEVLSQGGGLLLIRGGGAAAQGDEGRERREWRNVKK